MTLVNFIASSAFTILLKFTIFTYIGIWPIVNAFKILRTRLI